MQFRFVVCAVLLLVGGLSHASQPAADVTVTVTIETVDSDEGIVGMLVFASERGWPEDVKAAFRATSVRARKGNVVFCVQLPPGEYAVAVIHDANENGKLDRTLYGVPTEQWGMSNNPRPRFSAPSFDAARFKVSDDQEIHITLQ